MWKEGLHGSCPGTPGVPRTAWISLSKATNSRQGCSVQMLRSKALARGGSGEKTKKERNISISTILKVEALHQVTVREKAAADIWTVLGIDGVLPTLAAKYQNHADLSPPQNVSNGRQTMSGKLKSHPQFLKKANNCGMRYCSSLSTTEKNMVISEIIRGK